MSKNTKRVISIIVILLLVLAIIWAVYENIKPEPASVNPTNELPDENTGIDNIINDIADKENNTVVKNEIANEINSDSENKENETNKNESNGESELVPGTNASREEKAVQYAKKYYEEEYGSTEGIYFTCEEINGDGRYIVRVGNAGQGMNIFLLVNIENGEVTER